jgi:hypothetical protein
MLNCDLCIGCRYAVSFRESSGGRAFVVRCSAGRSATGIPGKKLWLSSSASLPPEDCPAKLQHLVFGTRRILTNNGG